MESAGVTKDGDSGFAVQAARGTGWSTLKGVVNKGATAVGVIVAARFLDPSDYGASALVLGVCSVIVLLPPLVMCDVLIARGHRPGAASSAAERLVTLFAIALSFAIVAASPVVVWLYPNFPSGTIIGLMLIMAVRPIFDALSVAPVSKMRIELRFRALAMIDGGSQLFATMAMIAMAIGGAGPYALVVPQTAAAVLRLAAYVADMRRVRTTESPPANVQPLSGAKRAGMFREFALAAVAQHAHTLIGYLPILMLGRLGGEDQTGIYTFAFYLSAQATFLVSYQVGAVLQPIFARFADNPERQGSAFLRSIAVVGAVAVPASLLQAALAEPILLVFFGDRWAGATSSYAVLSVGQAFFFAVAPAMALLRGQGRFKALLQWQFVQLACSIGPYAALAPRGSTAVAVIDTLVWGVAGPLAARICMRGHAVAGPGVLSAFAAPWLTSLPLAMAAWGAWLWLQQFGTAGAWVCVFGVGPLAGIAALALIRVSQPRAYTDLRPLLIGLVRSARLLIASLPSIGAGGPGGRG
jgi:O-antigen/teichoic acid export membrane protein